MEQTPAAVNWRQRNMTLPPGEHRNLSLQAIARGADGIMQFQWRQSRAGAEKFHSGMVPHAGADSRIYRQTVALGADLASLTDIIGAKQHAKVALLFDWDSWWALEQEVTPGSLTYVDIVLRWYRELWKRGILVDFVPPSADLSRYALVIAAATHVLPISAQENLAQWVSTGGRLVVGYQSAILNEDLHVILDGYLGALRKVLGVRIEEFAVPASTGIVPNLRLTGLAEGATADWAESVIAEGAEVRSRYAGTWLDGHAAITRNAFGEGRAWYVSTAPENLGAVVAEALEDAGIDWRHPALPDNVEIVSRGRRTFLINHTADSQTVDGIDIATFHAIMVEGNDDAP